MTTALTPEPRSGQQPASRDSEVAMLPTREPRLNRDEMLAAARDLIEHGYQLTLLYGTDAEGVCECASGPRCKSPGKHPRERQWIQRPIRTPEELTARWQQASGTPNIGVMPDDGLLVIDVDRKKGKRGAETLAAIEAESGTLGNPHQTTPSGGLHFVFRLPPETDPATLPNRSDFGEGIDILRVGRQFVAAPSQIGARPYAGSLPSRDELPVLPAAWLTLLQSRGGEAPSERTPTDPSALQARLEVLKAPSLEKVREVVVRIPNPGDTDRAKWVWMAHAIKGACGRAAETEGLAIFLEWAARWDGPVDPGEDERVFTTITWQNVHAGWADLWKLAAKHGYDATAERLAEAQSEFASAPSPGEVTDPTSPPRSLHDALVALRAHLSTITEPLQRDAVRDTRLARLGQALRLPFSVMREHLAALDAPHRRVRAQIIRPGPTLRDALSEAPPQALVPGYLYVDQQHVLYGAPQSLKTFTALDLGLHIASGLPWLGRVPVTQRGVVYFAGEAASGVRVRIAAWCAARGIAVGQAAGLPFALVDAVPTLGKGDDGLRDAISRVEEAAADFSVPVGLLVLDNMTRIAAAAGLSTTEVGEYGRILAGIDALGRVTKAATLTIYHVPVSDKAQSRPAGTYQSTANPDVIIKAERLGSGLNTLLRMAPPHGKSRSGAPARDLLLRLKEQDVRPWLITSYEQAGHPLPPPLANVAAEEFACVDPPDGLNGTATAMSPEAVVRESLRQQFTSLVVDHASVPQVVSTVARDQRADEDAELERRVVDAIDRRPGTSQNTLRAALRGTRKIDIDHAVLELVEAKLVDDRPKGSAHAYFLTDAGQARLRAATARDEAAAADGAAVVAELEQGAAVERRVSGEVGRAFPKDARRGRPGSGRATSSGSSRPRPSRRGEQRDDLGTTPAIPSSRSPRPHKGRGRTRSPARDK